ncbi:rRNA-binding ribosome biosynthesis protein utp25 [Agyrium rufum]|nr:rRNA-binding ribosome biosynthesis protein utp25 [Agyrium rufum]
MPLFRGQARPGGRGSSRGSLFRGSSFRSRGSERGRGRGQSNGRGNGRSRTGKKAAFYSTRVEDLNDPNGEEVPEQGEAETPNASDGEESPLSESDSQDDSLYAEKSHSVLLKVLIQDEDLEPKRKRRRLSSNEIHNGTPVSQSWENGIENHADENIDIVVASDGEEDLAATGGPDSDDEDLTSQDASTRGPFSVHFGKEHDIPLVTKGTSNPSTLAVRTVSPVSGWSATEYAPDTAKGSTTSIAKDPFLKQRLKSKGEKVLQTLTGVQSWLGQRIFHYQDMLFQDRALRNTEYLRRVLCLHALNHIFKTRDRILKNNTKLTRESSDDMELRDQGFTRPKVLFILPTRQACFELVEEMMRLCEPEQQENRKRFQDSFSGSFEDIPTDKPDDFRELFAGNDDDMFRIGLKFTRKNVKYFSAFYSSDILLASPLGLKMAIGEEGDKKKDYDFLSSIELCIIDHADAMTMQNWEHVEYIFQNMNLQPKEAHGCDFSRVRHWYLDGNAKYYRQTIVTTAFVTPDINLLFGRYMQNFSGRIRCGKETYQGTMLDLPIQLKQTFSRFVTTSVPNQSDERFKYFTNAIIPTLTRKSRSENARESGILIFIPSYMDFVRVRNFLATSSTTQNISFGSISEYTSAREVARARSHFYSGRHSVLLYTERAHHFRRMVIKGARKIIMYALPDNPIFYKELAGDFLAASLLVGKAELQEVVVRSVFSKFDVFKLQRIVGSQRWEKMIRAPEDTFDFV